MASALPTLPATLRCPNLNRKGFTLLEVVVASTLLLVIMYSTFQVADVVAQREKEEQLRSSLFEMRCALDQFHQDNLRCPDSFNELLQAPRPLGAFYLRRLPLNPMFASVTWEIASLTTVNGADDYWLEISSPATVIPGGPIIDVRCPAAAGSGLNGVPYQYW